MPLSLAERAAQLEKIKEDIIADNPCPDLAASATQVVLGEGSPEAEVVFIGEAPGAEEDKQGRPFVGAAGRFLDTMLESTDMSRADVYITNIVKYRPPNNRDPLPEEKEAFLPYLERQLAVIQPKLIVTLGRHSMGSFLPELRISEVHGQPKRKNGRVYLPMYHPAAALYQGNLRATLSEDFQKIPRVLEMIKNERISNEK